MNTIDHLSVIPTIVHKNTIGIYFPFVKHRINWICFYGHCWLTNDSVSHWYRFLTRQ